MPLIFLWLGGLLAVAVLLDIEPLPRKEPTP